MGRRYSQLDLDERIELNCLRDAGCSLRKIGKLMSRSHATISRELKRNSLPKAGYKLAIWLQIFLFNLWARTAITHL